MKKYFKLILFPVLLFAFIGIVGAKSFEISSEEEFSNAFKESGTYKLTADLKDTSTVTISSGVEVVLDLNGHSIEAGLRQAERHYYAIDNYGKFTLKDSIGGGYISARGIENLTGGNMTILSGEIIAIDSNGGAAIWNDDNLKISGGKLKTTHVGSPKDTYGAGCLNNGGTAVIDGGTFESVNRRTYAIISSGNITLNNNPIVTGAHGGLTIDSGTAVVNGGKYTSTEYYGLYVSNDARGVDPEKAAVTVNGGTFTGKSYSVWIGSDVNNPVDSVIEINDGIFNNDLMVQKNVEDDAGIFVKGGLYPSKNVASYKANGYSVYKENDKFRVAKTGTLSVKDNTIFIKVGETYSKAFEAPSNDYVTTSFSTSGIASINGSSIKGLKAGNTKLTITLNRDDDVITKDINISVYEVKDVEVVSEDIDEDINKETKKTITEEVSKIINDVLDDKEVKGISDELKENLKGAVVAGKEINTKVVISEQKTTDDNKDEIESINKKIAKGGNVIGYYDISIVLEADGDILGNIMELSDKAKITLDIPENLPSVKKGYKRVYKVIRMHDGVVTILDTKDNGNGTISFESNKYSTFALVYEDVSESALDDTPNTGISTSNKLIGLFAVVAGMVVITKIKKFRKVK